MRRQSVLDQLRARYPEEDFKAVRSGDGWNWDWVGATKTISPRSQLTPRHDGDDDSFVIVYEDQTGRVYGYDGLIL